MDMNGVKILAVQPRWFKLGVRGYPHQDAAAFLEQRCGPLLPSHYLEQCVEVANPGASMTNLYPG